MNQVVEDLKAARDLLVRQGWTTEVLYTGMRLGDGAHCAVGAVLAVTGGYTFVKGCWERIPWERIPTERGAAAIAALAQHLPALARKSYESDWTNVAEYNNGTFEGAILDLFNNTIADLTAVERKAEALACMGRAEAAGIPVKNLGIEK